LLSGERRSHAALARIGKPPIFANEINAVYVRTADLSDFHLTIRRASVAATCRMFRALMRLGWYHG
jgi:hypothetical protein